MKDIAVLSTLRELLPGIPVTVMLVASSLLIGLLLGLPLAAARLSRWRILQRLAYGYVYVFRGTPLILQVFFVYYGLGSLEWVRNSFLWHALADQYFCAILALGMCTAAYTSEIVRGGILAVPRGQLEAAAAFAMPQSVRLSRVTLPLAFRQMLPAYGNEIVMMVKATSVASVITIMDITGLARALASKTFTPIEVFVVAGAIYLAINALIGLIVGGIELRLARRGAIS